MDTQREEAENPSAGAAEPLLPEEKKPPPAKKPPEPAQQAREILRTTLGSLAYKFMKGMAIAGR